MTVALAVAAIAAGAACSAADPGVGGINRDHGGSSGGGSGGSSGGGSSGASSGGDDGGVMEASTTDGGMTLTDGMKLASSLIIAPTDTVTIAPGATISLPANATITVQGTLTATSSAGMHAKLSGAGWIGVVVAAGGTLALDGVDISGATTAIQAQANDAKAEYDNGTIDSATTPFAVDKGGKLSTSHATVTGTRGSSSVSGALVASHLDYDSNGHEGITTMDPGATLAIDDSTLHGAGPNVAADMIVSGSAKSIHVGYTTISTVHCAFHFNAIDAFDVTYSNLEGNAYGFMLYGSSGQGPRSVTYTNIANNPVAFDTMGNNGPITFDNDYVSGSTTGTADMGGPVTVTNPQGALIDGTGPRAN
jgi:hypothetical protein